MKVIEKFIDRFFLLQSNKPIMEKRRRARINNCLNELKALILDAMKKDVSATKKSVSQLDLFYYIMCQYRHDFEIATSLKQ